MSDIPQIISDAKITEVAKDGSTLEEREKVQGFKQA